MAEARRWPALVVRSADVDATGELAGLVTLALDGCEVLAIEDLTPLPLPPGGLWDPTAPPPSEPPPAPLWWRVCFRGDDDRHRAAAAITALDRGFALEIQDLPDDDWVARSQAANRAVFAGRFIVAPPWDVPSPVPPGYSLVVIDPSMGFGTGHHQTTRLCLWALTDLDVRDRTVLDLGTGSGVLAMAAVLAGARDATGIDIDPDAILAAQRSAALNVLPRPVTFVTADVFSAPRPAADVVFANLTGAMLTRVATRLATLTTPGGRLIVSGFMTEEAAAVEAALTSFTVAARAQEDGWCVFVLRRGDG